MRLTIEIDTEDAAATDDPSGEAAEILRRIAKRIDGRNYEHGSAVFDTNGNRVGYISFTPCDPECEESEDED